MKKINKIHKIYLSILVVAVLLVFFAGIIDYYGYTISNFKIVKTGTIILEVPNKSSAIFLDDTRREITLEENQIVEIKKVAPGEHTLIVGKDNYWPWAKTFNVEKSETVYINPLLIPKEIPADKIESSDEEYQGIVSKINTQKLSSQENKQISEDGLAEVWINGGHVRYTKLEPKPHGESFCNMEVKCSEPVSIFSDNEVIKNVFFYPSRHDYVIFDVDEMVYVLESDLRQPQNIFPIYQGDKPQIFVEESQIYIKDGSDLYEVNI